MTLTEFFDSNPFKGINPFGVYVEKVIYSKMPIKLWQRSPFTLCFLSGEENKVEYIDKNYQPLYIQGEVINWLRGAQLMCNMHATLAKYGAFFLNFGDDMNLPEFLIIGIDKRRRERAIAYSIKRNDPY